MTTTSRKTLAAVAATALCALALTATLTLSLTSSSGASAPGEAPHLRWLDGAQQYELTLETNVKLGLAGADRPREINQSVEGTLNLRVFETDGDRVVLGMQLSPVSMVVDGERKEARENELATPFTATFTPAGRPVSISPSRPPRPRLTNRATPSSPPAARSTTPR